MTHRGKFIAILLAGALGGSAFLPLAPGAAQSVGDAGVDARGNADHAAHCAAMSGLARGDVRITAATFYPDVRQLPAGPGGPASTMPAHCLIEGMINEREGADGKTYGIGFELALPEDWNGRYLLMGGGGLNGSVRPPTGPVASGEQNALTRRFAVASHDSGHKGAVFDSSFMADQRAALDFAESSVRTVTLATRRLTGRYYGSAPHHSYMTGCSTGGREGMLASQRYPELFDGIVVGAPAMRPGFSNLGMEYTQVLLNATLPPSEEGPASFTIEERSTVLGELLRQCDATDGSTDGMIMNVAACRSFDPSPLQCSAGETGNCIAGDRLQALEQAFAGPSYSNGRRVYVPIPWDTGIVSTGPGLPGYMPMGAPGPFGPASTARVLDIDQRMYENSMDAPGRLTDTAYWTNLSTYLDRGSKMMFFHGVSDPWFSAFDTWDYFQRASQANGADRWRDAARFYMVPGMMHCSGGNAFETFDLLGPLVEWAEGGDAPEHVLATRPADSAQQMKLCPHPQYAHYDGGPLQSGASYSCRMPD